MKKRTYYIYMPALSLIAACSTPDVSSEVKTFSSALEVAGKPLEKQLAQEVKSEDAAAKRTRISNGKQVYSAPSECDRVGTSDLNANISKCDLQRKYVVPNTRGTAVYSANAWGVIKSYEKSLNALISSKSPSEIKSSLSSFIQASNKFKGSVKDKPEINIVRPADIAPIASLAEKLSEAARGRAIKKLVNTAHIPLRDVIRELIAEQSKNDDLISAHKDLDDDYIALSKAQGKVSASKYASLVSAYENELKSFRKQAINSHSGRLTLVWRNQELLHAKVNRGSDPEALIAILEDIKILTK